MTTDRLFPLRGVSDQDTRFTFGLLVDVADVLARHDYPSIRDTASGADLVALRQTLFGFLYGTPARLEDTRVRARYACPAPEVCGVCHSLSEHAEYARHRRHDGTGRDDCPYCPTDADIAQWEAEQATLTGGSTSDQPPGTVPCGFGCGYQATSEADLDDHENAECGNRFAPVLPADTANLPPARPVASTYPKRGA